MDRNKVCRMSILFEKMVSQDANIKEQCELKRLYDEFIEEGRENRVLAQQNSRHHASHSHSMY